MEPTPQLTDIVHAIQLAVTPIFLLTGIGVFLSVLTTRLGRIVDRARVLEGQLAAADAQTHQHLCTALAVLARRARRISAAIALSTACALCVCSTVILLFLGSFLVLNLATVITWLFVAAMVALLGALIQFFHEILLGTRHLRIGPP